MQSDRSAAIHPGNRLSFFLLSFIQGTKGLSAFGALSQANHIPCEYKHRRPRLKLSKDTFSFLHILKHCMG